ncbi:unnamed protein product [Echinostoma caproni]|uniref:C2 domain-containing protein n=1 Tax=Echinostoma caproni TaxID=27848 RepID=A0A183AT35_9TREM|nr:unnamed protein product [Echinostoma caproni]
MDVSTYSKLRASGRGYLSVTAVALKSNSQFSKAAAHNVNPLFNERRQFVKLRFFSMTYQGGGDFGPFEAQLRRQPHDNRLHGSTRIQV